jgi:O-antigen/teichoic acid export membrane protein
MMAQVSGRRLSSMSAFLTTTGSTLLIALASGLFGVLSSRTLGPYERGLLATAVVWTSVITSIVAIGVPQAITYHVGRATTSRPAYAGTGLAIAAVSGALLASIGTGLALILAPHGADTAMAILFAAGFPLVVGGAGIAAVLGTGAYRTWGALRLLNPTLGLALLGLIVLGGGRTATWVAVAIATATTAQAAAVIWLMRKLDLVGRPRRKAARDLVSYGWRQVVSGAAWLLNYKLDQLVLSVVVAPAALGLYAVASSFGEIIALVAASAGSVMLVRAAGGGKVAASSSLRPAVGFSVAVAGTMAVFTAALAGTFLDLMFGQAFVPATEVLRILLLGSLGLAVAAVLADTLRGLGFPLDPAKAELAGACVSIGLLATLVPSQGIRGAAIASAVSYNFVMVLMALLLRARLKRVDVR